MTWVPDAEASGGLELTGRELCLVERAAELLVAPLAVPDLHAWQYDVLRTLKELLAADKASMMVGPPLGLARQASEGLDTDQIIKFPDVMQPLDKRHAIWRRQVLFGVSNRDLLWGPFREDLLRSAYYNEFIVPGRMYDALIVNLQVGRDKSHDNIAGLWFHHDRATGPKFGARGLAILRLLFPSFRAGMLMLRRLGEVRTALGRVIDALGQPAALFDVDGRRVHETPALTTALAQEPAPGHARVEAAIRGVAAEVARVVRGRASAAHVSVAPAPMPARQLASELATYRVSAGLAPPELTGGRPLVMVTVSVERLAAKASPGAAELMARFHLTRREAEVALLVATGHGTKATATRLGISPHTVRRHIENVYLKLGVHSRAEVSAVIHGSVR